MNRLRCRRPSPSMVVALLSLVVALGGTGYAAVTLPKNSVGAKQIKKNAVTGSKVRNGSLTLGDLANGTVLQGPQGATGATGPKGDKGDKGDTGEAGATTGAAGGDLTGNYPDPQLAPGSVGVAEHATVPSAHLRGTAATIPNTSSTSVTFATEVLDTDGMFDPGQADRLTIQTPGWYAVMGFVNWPADPDGHRRVRLNVPFNNGLIDGDFAASDIQAVTVASTRTMQTVSGVRRFAAGDTVGLRVSHDAGGPLDINLGASPDLTAVWLAP